MSKTQDERIVEVARVLGQSVTEGGKRDLSSVRLVEMEDEVYGLADRLSADLLQALLEQQSQQVGEVGSCPCCGGELEAKPPESKTLQLRRGRVQWKQPTWRCPRCRRDFFPSGGGVGM